MRGIVRLAIVALVLTILVSPALTTLPSKVSSTTPPAGTVMRMTLVGKPESLNQLTASPGCISCWRLMELEYAFGMPVKPDGSNYSQAGVFDWIKTNSNATVWDFNIRPGAMWSDGKPITSADINFSFGFGSGYIFGTPADFIGLSTDVTGVSVVNSSETQFVLNTTEPNFGLSLAAQFYYTPVPEHIWAGQNFSANPNFNQSVTSGPFYHESYDGGTDLILKANPYYWNGPDISQIDVNFITQSSQGPTLLQGNQTDLAQVDPDFVSGFLNNSHFGVNVEPDRGILYLEYNITESPFNDTAFRQAMAYGINTSGIVQTVYKGYATPGIDGMGTIPPSASEWHNPNTVQYQYNVTQAKNVLKNDGYTWDSSGNLHYPNGTAVTFKIYADSDVTTDFQTAQQVSNYLNALGMQTTVVSESLSTIAGDYTSGTGDIRSQLVVASNTSPIFGLGFLDIEPGYNIYFPWFTTQPNWILPASAGADFNGNTSIVSSSTNQAQVQQAVRNIDMLNSQYLPLIVLGYPDTIWVYRTDHLTGFPSMNSVTGFDMGAISLDPATFANISYVPSPTSTTSPTTTVPTTTVSSNSSTTTSSSTSSGSNTSLEILAAVLVIIVVGAVAVTATRMRRSRAPPAEPSPTA
jgi:ABC-type transport system substrate-binding protein